MAPLSRAAPRPPSSGPAAQRQWRPVVFLGACCWALRAAAEEPRLPLDDLALLHFCFGGDASVHDNAPQHQSAPSGGTISALSVQFPALERLAPYLRRPGARILDLGFGSGVMVAMMLAVAHAEAHVVGVDL